MKKGILFTSLFAGLVLCAADQTVSAAAPAQTTAAAPAQTTAAAPAKAAEAPAQTTAAAPAKAAEAPAKAEKAEKEEPGIAFCLARGVCNIATGWLEIPRCMIYDNALIPVFGLIVGIPEGAAFTVARELCGVFDILSFGTMGGAMHGEIFCDTVFQSNWFPPKK